MKWILVAGGSCDPEWLKNELDQLYEQEPGAWKCMGIDAGALTLIRAGYTPDHVTGDFDSVTDEEREIIFGRTAERTVLNPVKDDTDMEAALRYAVAAEAEELRIYGATGSRLDHTLTNIRLLMIPGEAGIPAVMKDPCNRIRIISGATRITRDSSCGKYISLLPLDVPVKGITLKGFRYPMENGELSPVGSLGVSNELAADEGEILFTEGRLLLMETRD